MADSVKKILDSVHGYINIPNELMNVVVDSPEFQRLKRIEQTSGRSIYPSARHDRFIHSLGVYYLGCRIVDSILERKNEMGLSESNKTLFPILYSYELACLMHDIGHSPFSHTFENKYRKEILQKALIDALGDEDFRNDFVKFNDFASHECMSALVVVNKFKSFIGAPHQYRYGKSMVMADLTLVVRMIVGCHYSQTKNDLQNVFIDLIHGDIDSDGLDYTCRDVWASGYQTASVDINRLINAIYINKDDKGLYQLSFDYKSINEIRSILIVKNYQQDYVIAHHTVVYEQTLLIKAMESAALYQCCEKETDDQLKREKALFDICNYDTMFTEHRTLRSGFPLCHPMDDDFIALMKCVRNYGYAREWFSRQYTKVPLWKHVEDFVYDIFKAGYNVKYKKFWMFDDDYIDILREKISKEFNILPCDIWIEKGSPKNKSGIINNLKIHLESGSVANYSDLYSEESSIMKAKIPSFCYIFVPTLDAQHQDTDIKKIRAFVIKQFLLGKMTKAEIQKKEQVKKMTEQIASVVDSMLLPKDI